MVHEDEKEEVLEHMLVHALFVRLYKSNQIMVMDIQPKQYKRGLSSNTSVSAVSLLFTLLPPLFIFHALLCGEALIP